MLDNGNTYIILALYILKELGKILIETPPFMQILFGLDNCQ